MSTEVLGPGLNIGFLRQATIFRPAHLVGTEDRLLNRIALLAKKTPTVPIIGDGKNKYATPP
jgi:NADH dehydrogenase (ubiquinone) 1 alpha subcomplex subunit 9